jgi:hypothetical protein
VRLKLFVILSALPIVFLTEPAHASSTTRVRFEETTDATMYGVHGVWDGPLINQSISCPNNDFQINYIDVFVRGNGNTSGEYIEGGARYQKQFYGGDCSGGSRQLYYAEWDIGSGTQGLVSINQIINGTREYALNQLSSGDWYFRVDGGLEFEIQNWNSSQISYFDLVRVGSLCYRQNGASGSDCDSTGKVNPANYLTYKPYNSYSGTWPDWAGEDSECVDYSHEARGKWNSTTGVQFGFNVTISGSFTGPSC